MNSHATEDTIKKYYERLKSLDRDGLLELLADDIVVHYYGPSDLLPWVGEFKGKAGFEAFFDIIAQHLDIVEVNTLDTIANERKVVVQCQGIWRVKATGKDVHGNMVNVFSVDQAKVSAYEVYNDTAAFAEGMRTR